jgi:hypothetical protein
MTLVRTRLSVQVFGGLSFLIGGTLLSGTLMLIALLPRPTAEPGALMDWVVSHSPRISLSNELMFVAVVFLMPAVLALGRIGWRSSVSAAVVGSSSLLLALIVLAVLVMIEGRLVYPVFGITLSGGNIALVVSLFYGGLHEVQLLLGIGLVAFGICVLRSSSRLRLALLSFAAGALQLAGAFPWLTPIWVNATVEVALFFWTLGIGFWLITEPPPKIDHS